MVDISYSSDKRINQQKYLLPLPCSGHPVYFFIPSWTYSQNINLNLFLENPEHNPAIPNPEFSEISQISGQRDAKIQRRTGQLGIYGPDDPTGHIWTKT